MSERTEDARVPLPTPTPEASPDRLAEVRQRLESGELDSDLALVETALALLDGDRPAV